ncbi:MAG: fatty acid desaturase [Gemmatimonadetes bacterium]|nr:fatty acid desaturase [Gemmatimonadota bacterium]
MTARASDVTAPTPSIPRDWRALVNPYARASHSRSIFQLVSTVGLLLVALVALYWSRDVSYLLTLALSLPTAGLLTRTFIIMHDCGHGSFFTSRRANDVVGVLTGFLTFMPYAKWRREHALHHASSGDLDRRGIGDIYTLTVQEYFAKGWMARLGYRLSRMPIFLLTIGPVYFFLHQRFPTLRKGAARDELMSVLLTNISVIGLIAILVMVLGTKTLLTTYLPAYYLSLLGGIWLFFAQHQFEDAYWAEHEEWDYANAAIRGSSYLKLPRLIQWFTGNIGLHHVHHLAPKVPNYKLEEAHNSHPMFQLAPVLQMPDAVKVLRLALYDEQQRKLVSFGEAKRRWRARRRG